MATKREVEEMIEAMKEELKTESNEDMRGCIKMDEVEAVTLSWKC